MTQQRPTSVTLLTLMVLTIGTLNVIRFWQTIKEWRYLEEILTISPLYLALTGFIWGFTGLMLAWGLFRGKNWAPIGLKTFGLVYFAYVWADRLLVSVTPNRVTNNLFMIIFTTLTLVIIFWITSRKNVRAYFGEPHEQ